MLGFLIHLARRKSIYQVGFFLEIDQWGSNGPSSVILGGPFSWKGVPKKVFELIGTDCPIRKRTFIDALPQFWATEKGWLLITAESRMFVWWNNYLNGEEKAKAIKTVRGYKSSK